ncbi:MAG TPA: TAT-variant-translocated molybdopterin oxidoreductase [Bryobacteraceae bacterium]|nr:TAT-variant-translocated molybdopterin oxidoreductase [Bryobacteraceae bacterium]
MNDKPALDLNKIRARLESAQGPLYWKSLEELAQTEEFQAYVEDEFADRSPDWLNPANRRNFLKLMGASLAFAGVTACTKQPKETIVPYVRQPEDFVPGVPLYYATAMQMGGVGTGLLVTSHLGRPTKVDGNPDHPGSLGASDYFQQASILTMYDPDRGQAVTYKGQISSWISFQAALAVARERAILKNGEGLRILTETVTSPTLTSQIQKILKEMPSAKWHSYEPCGRHNAYQGALLAFGRPVNTIYRFDQADVIVSLDADFLSCGPGNLLYARQFADKRRVQTNVTHTPQPKEDWQEGYQEGPIPARSNQSASYADENRGPVILPPQVQAQGKPPAETTLNRMYVFEAAPSPTGGMADHRFILRASEVEAAAWDLAAALGISGATSTGKLKQAAAIARDLQAHKGACVVIAGDHQPPAVHALAHAMNAALGNAGKTVTYTDPIEGNPVDQGESLRQLVADMNGGKVDTLLILAGNPVYSAPVDLDFAAALKKVATSAYLGLFPDETAALVQWYVPEAHYLESWSDVRGFDGTVSFVQPLIAPLYGGKTAHEVISTLAGEPGKFPYDIVRDYWQSQNKTANFEIFWQKALHDGVVPNTAVPAVTVTAKTPPPSSARAAQGFEIAFRPDPTIWDGSFANNGWLQELPKPHNKMTWDNAVWISPSTAQQHGLNSEEMVELKYQGRTVTGPVWIMPGHANDAVTVHLGYGRTRAGQVGNEVGFSAYLLRTSAQPNHDSGLEIRRLGGRHPLATTQHAQTMEGTDPVRVATLDQYKKSPQFVEETEQDKPLPPKLTLYPDYRYQGYKWGMTLDLNACVGCSACVAACQAENNISVVGKEEVARGRHMHWIRVDRYYKGNWDNPELYYQPVPCMQCENAPCELVCPVAATVHSGDGLNQMVYNRCVGTRYCSNNCPYKVRRFNFLLYSDWNTQSLYGLRNPNVSVRSRGVMEKCTYCVQRINAAKIQSEKENRRIADGEIVPACVQVCPTQAIVFGDINDPKSRVAQLKAQARNYSLLEDLSTRPRTTYLGRLRNPNPEIEKG